MKIPEMPTLQMIRTNPAHFGTTPVVSSATSPEAKNIVNNLNTPISNSSFKSYLLDSVGLVNQQQLDVTKVQQQLITDPDSVDIHDVTTAMSKAQMSLNLAQTVVDRLITGWSEITTVR